MLKKNPFVTMHTTSNINDVWDTEQEQRTFRLNADANWRIVRDGFPVTEGHTLIYSCSGRRSLFECSMDEIKELHMLMQKVRHHLTDLYGCDAFNYGINEGEAAGQTISVLHVHIIPRRVGDMDEPKGGVRGVIPEKQSYTSKPDDGWGDDITSIAAVECDSINSDAETE